MEFLQKKSYVMSQSMQLIKLITNLEYFELILSSI